VREVNILKAIQTGGTLVSELSTLWVIGNDPGPIMWTFQSDEDAKEHCKSRWNPLLQSVECLRPLMPRSRHSKNTQEIYFGPYFLIVNGANINSLQSKSIRWKINDETWLWKDGLLSQAKGRVSAFEEARTSKIINISQAGIEDSDWDTQSHSGTWADWGFRCECGKAVKLVRDNLKWDEDAKDDAGAWVVSRCAETARLQCPHCGKVYEDSDHTRAKWNKAGEYVVDEHRRGDVLTFRWNALVNRPMQSLVADLAEAENLRRRGATQPLAEVLQQRFAEFVSEETFAEEVEITAGDYAMADYFNGDLKLDGEVKRFMSIDRQINRYYATVRAYRGDGSSRLIWATQTQTVEQLLEIQKRMNIADFHVGLDSSYQTEDCYRICAEPTGASACVTCSAASASRICWRGSAKCQNTGRHPATLLTNMRKPFRRRRRNRKPSIRRRAARNTSGSR